MAAPLELHDTITARTIDARATALLGGDGFTLMQRAGQAACDLLLQRWPRARRIVVACGTGNNGGDGYVLAHLLRRLGRDVRVVHPAGGGPRSPLAQRACTDYLGAGGHVDLFPCALDGADLLVDALFGIGLDRAPDANIAALIEAINATRLPVLALDVPSGIDAARGIAPGAAVQATTTLQFIVAHAGLYTGDALEYGGELLLAGLDVPASAFDGLVPRAHVCDAVDLLRLQRPRRRNSHKGESGRVLCIGGNTGTGGAVMLAAEAALRAGAGLVSVATRALHVAPLLARCPEVMVRAVDDLDAVDALIDTAGVIALGPGLGQDDWARGLWQRAVSSQRPLVLDADALNLLATQPRALAGAVLTPHPGEAGRLLGIGTDEVQRDRLGAAEALCRRFDAVVVLKGAGSVVATPGQPPRIIGAGNPGMAVGGMGDLLTGVIAALLAQGHPAFEAASLGALLHACAGDAAARDGERGLLPTDLLPQLRHLSNPGASA